MTALLTGRKQRKESKRFLESTLEELGVLDLDVPKKMILEVDALRKAGKKFSVILVGPGTPTGCEVGVLRDPKFPKEWAEYDQYLKELDEWDENENKRFWNNLPPGNDPPAEVPRPRMTVPAHATV